MTRENLKTHEATNGGECRKMLHTSCGRAYHLSSSYIVQEQVRYAIIMIMSVIFTIIVQFCYSSLEKDFNQVQQDSVGVV